MRLGLKEGDQLDIYEERRDRWPAGDCHRRFRVQEQNTPKSDHPPGYGRTNRRASFLRLTALKEVVYAGTEEDWEKIRIGRWNEPLHSARKA